MAHTIPDQALDHHVAILAKTGAGKTVLAKTLAERLLDQGHRVCIVDPTGAWWGLRLEADGVTPAYDVAIFGGRHADAPIGRASGRRLAEIIARGNVVVVISAQQAIEKARALTEKPTKGES